MSSSIGGTQARNCVQCGRSIQWDANVCPYCGHDYRIVMSGRKEESSKPVIGGVLILVGALGLLLLTFWCFIIAIPLAIIAMLGAVFAIQRKQFVFAVIAGILTIPTIIGLIGLILIILSKDEFT